ncbi:MAG: sulfotransferase family protein [Burkholderiales bacterium]
MKSPKIFGVGLSRTGTTSLHVALLRLGYASVHYPLDAAACWLAGNFSAHDPLAEFDACLDIPTSVYFRELDKAYPGSRFILTIRNEDHWAASIEKLHARLPPPSPHTQLRDMVRLVTYGTHYFHPERYRRIFNEHNDAVREYFRTRPESLLVMDVSAGEGWNKLCPFLGIPVPAGGFPSLSSPEIGWLSSVSRHELDSRRAALEHFLSESQFEC